MIDEFRCDLLEQRISERRKKRHESMFSLVSKSRPSAPSFRPVNSNGHGYTENDVPQPQEREELGLMKLKP
jgi:hypothetical protein